MTSPVSLPRGIANELLWVDPAELIRNDYNINVLPPEDYAKLKAAIEQYGFVDPVTVRPYLRQGTYEIIDGEHRAKAATELKLKLIPIIVVEADDDTAEKLSLIFNELHGSPDAEKLRDTLARMAKRTPVEQLMQTLPFAREQFLDAMPPPRAIADPGQPVVRWVERMYRLPRTAADTLDAALAMAKEDVQEDWQALEAIAQAYLDS